MRGQANPNFAPGKLKFSREEFAEGMGVSLKTVDREIKRGKIRVDRFGGRILIDRSEFDRVFEDGGDAA